MRRVNCNCDMPYGVYLDWLEDVGWCVDELRMEEEEFVFSSRDGCYEPDDTGYGYEDEYGDAYSIGERWGDGSGYQYADGSLYTYLTVVSSYR